MSSISTSIRKAIWVPAIFVGILWLVKGIELTFGLSLSHYGLYPQDLVGLRGIIFAPFLHGDLAHLAANTAPLLILGFVIFSSYTKVAWRSVGLIWLLTGIWVWVGARESYHIGASGLIYGFAFFIVTMGFLRKDKRAMALAGLVAFLYGGLVWGLLPVEPGVSWESHAMGAVSGLFAALMYYQVDPIKDPDLSYRPEEIRHLPYYKYEVEGDLKKEYRSGTEPSERPSHRPVINYRFVPRDEHTDSTATQHPAKGE